MAIPRVVVKAHGAQVSFEDHEIEESNDARGIRWFLRQGNFYEAAFLDYIRSLGLKGAYVDVGGFIGTHALYFAMLCPSEHVYTFEPRPRPRGELERNVAANGLQHKLTVSELGLGDARRRVEADVDGEHISFDCVPMDDVVERPVSLIKIDVEGMEVDVLRGAQRILDRFHPVVFAEAHTHAHRQAIADYLAKFGYVRTGRVFNASPTYEYAHIPEAGAEDIRRAYDDLRRAYADVEHSHDAAKRLQELLTAAQHKYREATARETAVTAQLRTAEAENRRLRAELQRLEPRLRAEEKQRAQETMSFRLGNAVIKATQSPRGLVALPGALLGLRRRSKKP